MDRRELPDPDPEPEPNEIPCSGSDPDWVPEPWELEGPAVSISLGDAADLDPALLAAMCGPDGLGGQGLGAAFGQDEAADVLRPGPVLAAITEQAVGDAARLSDDELTGALRAARRLENRAAYQQMAVIAEFTRRRAAEHEAARARRVPAGRRPGEFSFDELAMEMLITSGDADARMSVAIDLTTRLPRTMEGMAGGVIDYARAAVISFYTRSLTPADAACADEILAAAAPGLRTDALSRKAARLEMRLDPEAARARKEHARQTRQRVEIRREASGNAALSGRELPAPQALASKANIDAIAARLRAAGVEGTLDQLRALAFLDLTQSRNPLDRVTASPPPAPGPAADADEPAASAGPAAPAAGPSAGRGTPAASGALAPLPALINLTVPIGTLLGWSTEAAEAGGWGLLDPRETRDIVAAASRDPRTRWCLTLLGLDGTAAAHGCSPGRHPWTPATPATTTQAAALAELLRRLNITIEPITASPCAHARAENRYTPSRKLKHLIRARTTTCAAPGCGAQAAHCDIDHTTPYPQGPTCTCNLGPLCRKHHRAKQAYGWRLKQHISGIFTWTLPSGRTHTSTPTRYPDP